MEKKKQKKITKALMIIYLLFLTWVILFKMQINFSNIIESRYRNINFIPFQDSLVTNGRIDLEEIVWNIVIFIPFGVYLSIWKEEWSFLKKAAPVFFSSLAFEAAQYIFAIGASDITDLCANTIGGMIGILFFWLLSKVLKENTIKVINILAIVGTVAVIGLFGIVIIVNL